MREKNKTSQNTDQQQMRTLRKLFVALGMAFPLASASSAESHLKPDEFVMFLPDIAYQNDNGDILAGIQTWVYEKEKRRGLTHILALFLGIDMSALTAAERRQLYARTQLFRVDSERGKEVFVQDEDNYIHKMPKTASNGRSHILAPVKLDNKQSIKRLYFYPANIGKTNNADIAVAIYAPPTGLSVISDIDDTIKHSFVVDKRQLLINTFLNDFTAIDQMANFYREININNDVAYHYVSSSPIQLFPVLHEFMIENNYPLGTMHLREATRWSDIVPLLKASRTHKIRSIERLLRAYPKRKFLLIGDSVENDPAIYADLGHRFPDQIYGIIIRHATPKKSYIEIERHLNGLDRKTWIIASSVDDMRNFFKDLQSANKIKQ
ncbi:phosphatidate phosphatase App1 family protein [Bartonella tamiae]|uniref:Phosphatidate phosphatase APP1 catalytic domain-containing protein n=1 Tax=Bartonella tamiae Th239 TaxID=1094558 RepID=J0R7J3_9HYPH|nr:phosphatase domain-containing protein [Bartonella tamiae]EJF91704.1 hypothetical protein ME5_00083 [Bartonella tamiae Th239]EJF92629.1 hypothetical protein MEG_01799 [Bartonella tamiae Th307]